MAHPVPVLLTIPWGGRYSGRTGGAIRDGVDRNKLADLDAMAPYVVAFSDDGKGVQDREMMRAAMLKAKQLGRLIVAHCEDNSLLHGGFSYDGHYGRTHGQRGICYESEWSRIERLSLRQMYEPTQLRRN